MVWEVFPVSVSSVSQSYPTVCDPVDCSMLGLPVHHQLLEYTQTHVHWVGDAIQPSHPLLSLSPPTFNLSQHQGIFQWVSYSHQVAKVLEFQLQYQSFQWIFMFRDRKNRGTLYFSFNFCVNLKLLYVLIKTKIQQTIYIILRIVFPLLSVAGEISHELVHA